MGRGTAAVVDGAMDALDRVAGVVVRLGDRVAVEHPTFPPLLDLLDLLGAEVVGIDVDAHGMRADQLAAAVADGVELAVDAWTPGTQAPSPVPFVLVHGLGATKVSFLPTAVALATTHASTTDGSTTAWTSTSNPALPAFIS